MNKSNSNLFILICILTIDLLSFTCILPLFPSILDFYAKNALEIRNNNSANKIDFLYQCFEYLSKWLQNLLDIPDLERYNNVFIGGIFI